MIERIIQKIDDWFTKVIGVNWRTTISGFITLLSGFVLTSPEAFAFLRDMVENWMSFGAKVVLLPAGGAFAALAKDGAVTGGKNPATAEARRRIGME